MSSSVPTLNLFHPDVRSTLESRLERLSAASERQWGTMTAGQMCAHCATALAVATSDTPRRQALIGKLLSWMVRGKLLGPAPFDRNMPTDPTFVMKDERDFAAERTRLAGQIELFVARGPESAAKNPHGFLGRMSGEEWGVMMAKHLDHHLRQFGV